ncbi:hypothetical protein ACFFLZ_06270 [Photobacterium aphoticum]|uniref:hypothetical protein n=1 Tax=Photobacterium aphoticum TaxID=754436 RepID=UPI00069E51E6|nr:hypothetical protein [Photobacterium aphoticum]PSU60218.1 hypothetical protein C9I90_00940 [Photobacterium aphoticum]GHA34147.1 hypothetical protein GCM10007086_04360 [Photobacterium aphoticum]
MLVSYFLAGLSLTVFPAQLSACTSMDEAAFANLTAAQQKAHLASCSNEDSPQKAVTSHDTVSQETVYSSSKRESTQRLNWKDDSTTPKGSFWDNWAKQLDAPVLSSNSDESFYGLGFWLPDRFANEDIQFDDTMEWIKKYGLQMSFGIGGEDGESPRVRFDYRWHEESDLDDVFIQVEIPFQ